MQQIFLETFFESEFLHNYSTWKQQHDESASLSYSHLHIFEINGLQIVSPSIANEDKE